MKKILALFAVLALCAVSVSAREESKHAEHAWEYSDSNDFYKYWGQALEQHQYALVAVYESNDSPFNGYFSFDGEYDKVFNYLYEAPQRKTIVQVIFTNNRDAYSDFDGRWFRLPKQKDVCINYWNVLISYVDSFVSLMFEQNSRDFYAGFNQASAAFPYLNISIEDRIVNNVSPGTMGVVLAEDRIIFAYYGQTNVFFADFSNTLSSAGEGRNFTFPAQLAQAKNYWNSLTDGLWR